MREAKRVLRAIFGCRFDVSACATHANAKRLGRAKRQCDRNEESRKTFLSQFHIRDDGRVNIPYLCIDIVLGCNLRCAHCDHLSPYRKGFIPTDKIVHQFETWSKKIHPVRFKLLGGEPFLHPDLEEIVYESRKIWNDSKLEIGTNGLLLSEASQNIFDALKKEKIHVLVSDHSGIDLSHEKIIAGCARLEKNEISYELIPSNNRWHVAYRVDNDGIPNPFQSLPHEAWSKCVAKRCPSLANNQLYKCTVLASIIEGVKKGTFSASRWRDALTYVPLTSDADANSILKHFLTEDISECCVCPDKIMITAPTQIPLSHSGRKIA